jgi:hypothetical protein
VGVSILLSTQLVESCWKRISREHILTWTWFLLADGCALTFGWAEADTSLRVLLSVWVLQCALVIGIEMRNRLGDDRRSGGAAGATRIVEMAG